MYYKSLNKFYMNANTLDLDIDNYNLEDILNLFKISNKNFNETDLKRAKQIVLKTHPDKSNLPSNIFIFYSKAYKTLYSIWEFRKCGSINDNSEKNTDYSSISMNNSEEEKRELLNQFFDKNKTLNKSKNFNKWFNEEFDKIKMYNENDEKGYGDWLKTDEDMEKDLNNVTMANMAQEFDRKKSKARALIVHEGIKDFSSNTNASELSMQAPGSFNSDMFSNLPYQDLQQAHINSVIPVTEEDYENVQKFNNVNEFISYRNTQNTKPLSEQQALNYLKNRTSEEEEISVKRAYDLAKQTELAQQKQQKFWSNIQLLDNRK